MKDRPTDAKPKWRFDEEGTMMMGAIIPRMVRYDAGHTIRLCRTKDAKYYVWPDGPAGTRSVRLYVKEPMMLETEPGTGLVLSNVSELVDSGYLRVLDGGTPVPAGGLSCDD